jgi:hypothetical protein
MVDELLCLSLYAYNILCAVFVVAFVVRYYNKICIRLYIVYIILYMTRLCNACYVFEKEVL